MQGLLLPENLIQESDGLDLSSAVYGQGEAAGQVAEDGQAAEATRAEVAQAADGSQP